MADNEKVFIDDTPIDLSSDQEMTDEEYEKFREQIRQENEQ